MASGGLSQPHPCLSVVKEAKTNKNEIEVMNNKFDDLAKGLAQSVTRRQALKRFSLGLAGMALACFGLADRTEATPYCPPLCHCGKGLHRCITTVPKSCPNYETCKMFCTSNCL